MAIENTLPLPLEVILPVIAAIAAFAVAAGYTGWVAKQKPGTKEMLEISEAVRPVSYTHLTLPTIYSV